MRPMAALLAGRDHGSAGMLAYGTAWTRETERVMRGEAEVCY